MKKEAPTIRPEVEGDRLSPLRLKEGEECPSCRRKYTGRGLQWAVAVKMTGNWLYTSYRCSQRCGFEALKVL